MYMREKQKKKFTGLQLYGLIVGASSFEFKSPIVVFMGWIHQLVFNKFNEKKKKVHLYSIIRAFISFESVKKKKP